MLFSRISQAQEKIIGESPMSENKSVNMKLTYDEEGCVFLMGFYVEGESVIAIKLSPDNFQNLTADMVKAVKNYNLQQAKEYTERQKQIETSI